MNIKNIQKVLLECYSKDLCYPKVQCDWNENNRCFGMCAITSLIINDYFGGDICKIYVDGISHYFNLIENNIVDLTKNQFNREMDYKDYKIMDREKILTDDTKNRYITLKARLINKLLRQVDKKVYSCKSCEKLVDKFPDDVVNALARMLLPEIQKAYESAEGQAEFEKWKAEQSNSQTDKHNEK